MRTVSIGWGRGSRKQIMTADSIQWICLLFTTRYLCVIHAEGRPICLQKAFLVKCVHSPAKSGFTCPPGGGSKPHHVRSGFSMSFVVITDVLLQLHATDNVLDATKNGFQDDKPISCCNNS